MLIFTFLGLFPTTVVAQLRVTPELSLYVLTYEIQIPHKAKSECEIRFASPFLFKYSGLLADGITSSAVSDGKYVWHFSYASEKVYLFADKYNYEEVSNKLGAAEASSKLFAIATSGFPAIFSEKNSIATPLRMQTASRKPEQITIDSKVYTQITITSDTGVSARLRYNDVGILSEYIQYHMGKEIIKTTLKKCLIKLVRRNEIDELVKFPSDATFVDKSNSIHD